MTDDVLIPIHYVCTHEKAFELIQARSQFWVSNCGCREERKSCARSRMDVCLIFTANDQGSGSDKREISLAEAIGIVQEAESKNLVSRPYRNITRTDTDGICFCCDDCCDYFFNPGEVCDRGESVAETDFSICSLCGACEEVCFFNARKMNGSRLLVDNELCYGCGLCVSVCPKDCIQMVSR